MRTTVVRVPKMSGECLRELFRGPFFAGPPQDQMTRLEQSFVWLPLGDYTDTTRIHVVFDNWDYENEHLERMKDNEDGRTYFGYVLENLELIEWCDRLVPPTRLVAFKGFHELASPDVWDVTYFGAPGRDSKLLENFLASLKRDEEIEILSTRNERVKGFLEHKEEFVYGREAEQAAQLGPYWRLYMDC